MSLWSKIKNKCNSVKPCSDCSCGCTDEARNSVRLTDAEIAEDVLGDVCELIDCYNSLLRQGCDCADKLNSCLNYKSELVKFVQDGTDKE